MIFLPDFVHFSCVLRKGRDAVGVDESEENWQYEDCTHACERCMLRAM
jgi:hypothetical protein